MAPTDKPDQSFSSSASVRQIHLKAFVFGELRCQDQCSVLQPLADDLGPEPVGGRLQLRNVIDSQEGIVVFMKGDLSPLQPLLDEAVACLPCLAQAGRSTM